MVHDESYIQKTFELAKKGIGKVSPNPLVGAILVKKNAIIGMGYHAQYGGPHAELSAIEDATSSPEGATLYCNLEPCSHTNKQTPPCAQRIIKEKIKRVVIANKDPNPHVNGKGINLLRDAGIEVIEGVLEQQAYEINEVFFTRIEKKRPFIHLKWAQSLDGNIATHNGNSKWISNSKALEKVHELRTKYDAILVGQNTLLHDNPHLTVRLKNAPIQTRWRIVLTALSALHDDLNILKDQYTSKTLLITSIEDIKKNAHIARKLKKNGIHIEAVNLRENGILELSEVMRTLCTYNITSILVEGGRSILTSFYNARLWDRISIFIAPIFIGNGITPFSNLDINYINQTQRLNEITYEHIDDSMHCLIKKGRDNTCLQD